MVRVPLNCAILTISDTRTVDNDTSGALLAELAGADGPQGGARGVGGGAPPPRRRAPPPHPFSTRLS
jgi:hypothetical protein